MNKNDFSYYEFEVGREGYKPETTKLVWNVLFHDFNGKKIVVENLFELNCVFLIEGLLYAKKHYANDFNKFAEHIQNWLQYEYWARCEYEVVVSEWGSRNFSQKDLDEFQKRLDKEQEEYNKKSYNWEASVDVGYHDVSEKIDIYTQVMMNWDRFIEYVWNNKKLITKKKLGL